MFFVKYVYYKWILLLLMCHLKIDVLNVNIALFKKHTLWAGKIAQGSKVLMESHITAHVTASLDYLIYLLVLW